MEREQRERHPLHHLQLEVAVVLEVIRVETEDDPRDEPGSPRSGEPLHQQRRRNPR